jgi:ribosome-associated toxin RatA of RatAB toxin-antitoxin module
LARGNQGKMKHVLLGAMFDSAFDKYADAFVERAGENYARW